MLKDNPCGIDLGFSDTDSFLFQADDGQSFRKHIHKYIDYSNYDPTHPLYTKKNKSKLGYFKDELAGKYNCKKFIGLRSKCYALKLTNVKTKEKIEKKTCKGLARIAIKNRLLFEHYEECLNNGKPKRFGFSSIRSFNQSVYTVYQNKKALSHFDSKRWIYDCGIHSSPYGSLLIKNFYNKCPKC